MLILVDDIKDDGLRLRSSEAVETFPALVDMEQEGVVRFLSPLEVEVRAQHVSGLVEVEGKVEVGIRLSCSCCLQEFDTDLVARFALTYARELPDIEGDETDEGIELSAEEMGLILFDGESIDLAEGIQEEVVMAVPFRPLCRPECRGLCPQCGADRNERSCNCSLLPLGGKFAALKNFKVEKQ